MVASHFLAAGLMVTIFVSSSIICIQQSTALLIPTDNCGRVNGCHASTTHKVLLSDLQDSNEEEIMVSPRTARRAFLGGAGALVGVMAFQVPAVAKYGDSSNMELPNYIEFLMEKNAQGITTKTALYKGVDPVVLLQRLQDANNRLQDIPKLATEKKWSQVQGLLTGPLGTLSQTINQIATPDSGKDVQAAAKKLKADLIDIGQSAAKKNAEACIAKAGQATKDLTSFLELAFD